MPPAGPGHHRRAAARLAGVRAAAGPAADRQDRTRTAPDPTGSAAGRQGVLEPGIRSHLRRRRITATIPEKNDQQKTRTAKGSAGGRPPAFDAAAYKNRNTTERAINKLKAFRAVAMRTDKREFVFRGTIDTASVKIWLRNPTDQDPRDTP